MNHPNRIDLPAESDPRSLTGPAADTAIRPLVAARGLGVRRRGQWAVRHVDLHVHPGEIVTLIGPNGAGKSTVVSCVLGLLEAHEGVVERKHGLSVGYVPQKLTIDRSLPMTVERFLSLTGTVAASARREALDAVGMVHLARRPLTELSGGEFQRALIARAIVRRPDLLVLDEPVQGVDFTGEVALYELIASLRDRLGCGVLLISHDLHIVMARTDRVVCLNGHVCCSGAPLAVAATEEYRALFGPRAAEAIAFYEHHHDHVHGPDGCVADLPADHAHADHAHANHPQANHPQANHPQANHPQANHPQAGIPGGHDHG